MAYALAAHVVSTAGRITTTTVCLTVESRRRVDVVLGLLAAVAAKNTDATVADTLVRETLQGENGIEFPIANLGSHLSINPGIVVGPQGLVDLQHEEESALIDLIELCARVQNPHVCLELV